MQAPLYMALLLILVYTVCNYMSFFLRLVEPTVYQLMSTFLEKAGVVEGQVNSMCSTCVCVHACVCVVFIGPQY